MAETGETQELLRRIAAGKDSALEQLLARDRDMIRHMVRARLGTEMQARVDPSDVVQETCLQISGRIREYLTRNPMPYLAWVRQTVLETILRLRRRHIDADCRSIHREESMSPASSRSIARHLLAGQGAPDAGLIREEEVERVRLTIADLPQEEQEVLLMRIVEGLTNREVAEAMGSDEATASRRFGRALLKLRSRP